MTQRRTTTPAPKSLFIVTLGCSKNRVDSEVILGTLLAQGHRLVDEPAEAKAIIVNTCAFVRDAKEESVQTILELAEQKRTGRCQLLLVAGCLAQRYIDELLVELPEVDHFVGTGGYAQIADLLAADALPRAYLPALEYIHSAATPRVNSMARHTAFVKISEGCDNACAFCAIPMIRGAQRSRPMDDIAAEVARLARQGCVEFNLIAQDLTAYGQDLPGRPRLHELLRYLCGMKGAEAPRWLRLHYAYPRDFPDALIETIAAEPQIVKYLDMPLQHISDPLLRAMRRGKDAAFIRKLLTKLRERIPGLVLRTSLISGLPGETEEQHRELLDFVAEQRFERLGCFEFSPEEGTRAATMEKQVARRTIARRRREVMALQRRISREQNRAMVGKRIELLVEGVSPETEHLLIGRHAGQSCEGIDGVTYINEGSSQPGELVQAEVVQAADYDLVARIV